MPSVITQPDFTLLTSLQPSVRLPVLFLGHGSPMNAIEDNAFHRSWKALGNEFGDHAGAKWPKPQLILCISAHWITQGWQLTAMAQPKTIHDFGGFPQALFDQQYPAPGHPAAAQELAQRVRQPHDGTPLGLDTQQWGLDHGAWGVLKPMFPQADIAVVQLSIDYSRPPAEHFALGQQLAGLRERGVLIVASGNTVHNLRAIQMSARADQTYDWAVSFDQWCADHITQGQLAELVNFQALGHVAKQAHPSYDHYLPLLYAAGAAASDDPVRFFNESYQAASIAMRSVVWGV